ncbi:glutathione S-transferase C-terminal domain-containing protein [Microcoleus sp. F4-D5]|uniref:glutathione S-transferase C-terminal domain-containing protein n=1 Tax=Microcoleus sp. F4-D5 TaxID=2818760 RepID=UPI002FD2E811
MNRLSGLFHKKGIFWWGGPESPRTWLEFEHPTIADAAIYPYIALARDGKIELDAYPNVLNWIDRVKQLSGYIPMLGI